MTNVGQNEVEPKKINLECHYYNFHLIALNTYIILEA